MNDKGDKGNYGRGLSAHELRLFKDMMRDVDPMEGKNIDDIPDEDEESEARPPHRSAVYIGEKKSEQKSINADARGLDRKTAERLRKGKIPIEARLDMHGMSQIDAREALGKFITGAHAHGKRCVLLITGTGKPKASSIVYDESDWTTPRPGVLKRRLPEWLNEEPLRPLVLETAPARQKDGGDGAVYVLLRRKRD